MKHLLLFLTLLAGATCAVCAQQPNYARHPRFKAILYHPADAEPAHLETARDALEFFHRLSYGEGYTYEKTTSLAGYSLDSLLTFNIIVAINCAPSSPEERSLFQSYMENGGGWMGLHAAAYNDASTNWPWFNTFLGCGRFFCNNWPPQPALLDTRSETHPVTKSLPAQWVAPESEWYQWDPAPSENPDVEVLLSISPKNYPLGIKDIVSEGDFPVVWTNRRYRMIYLNMGHGDREFSDATQNLLFVNAFRWVVSQSKDGDPFTLRHQ